MDKRIRRPEPPPLLMMAELVFASWETVMHRTWMMAQGTCPPAEYRRMMFEKMRAAQHSALALMISGGTLTLSTALAPWHRRARANALRLRRR